MMGRILKRIPNWVWIAVILLATGLVYANIIPNKFVWDDNSFILKWPGIRHINLKLFFMGDVPEGHGGVYRPLRSVFYALSYKLYGLNPAWYHLQAILLHLAGTYLTYLLLKKITKDQAISLLSAAFFGLHPVHVENIAFTTASFDLFAPVFFLSSLIFFISFLEKKKSWELGGSLALGFLSFLSGETALVLPLCVVLVYLLLKGQEKAGQKIWKQAFRYTWVFFLMLGVYIFIRVGIVKILARGSFDLTKTLVLWIYMVRAFWRYISLLFFPYNLTVDYEVTREYTTIMHTPNSPFWIPFVNLNFWLGVFSLVASAVFFVRYRKKQPLISFSIAWYYISILPFSNLLPVNAAVAERYLYLPSIGWCLLVSYVIVGIYRHFHKNISSLFFPGFIALITIAVLVLFSIRTYLRNRDFYDNQSLWEATYKSTPESGIALNNLGNIYADRKNYDKALALFEKIKKLAPAQRNPYYNIGQIYFLQGKFEEASISFNELIKRHPDDTDTHHMLAKIKRRTGKPEEGYRIMDEYIKRTGKSESYAQLGMFYLDDSLIEKGKEAFGMAIQKDPNNVSAYNNLAVIYLMEGKYPEAVNLLQKAIYIFPEDPEYYYNLGGAYQKLGRETEAKKMMEKAVALAPQFEEAKSALESLYKMEQGAR